MSESPFERGDFFTTLNPSRCVGKSIHIVQKYRTIGMPSNATHGGFFLDPETIIESLWTVKRDSVWKYEGRDFLVGRWTGMTDERFARGWEAAKKYEGKYYPAPRMLMFLFTPMLVQLVTPMRWIGLGFFSPFVCTEYEAYFGGKAGFSVFKECLGMVPARVANIIRRDKDVEIIHDGVLE